MTATDFALCDWALADGKPKRISWYDYAGNQAMKPKDVEVRRKYFIRERLLRLNFCG